MVISMYIYYEFDTFEAYMAYSVVCYYKFIIIKLLFLKQLSQF